MIVKSSTSRVRISGAVALGAKRKADSKRGRQQRAFSLIEMIGVITVLALLALALTPLLIKYFDRVAAEKEELQLRAFADAFRQNIAKTRVITSSTGWVSAVASTLGLATNDVIFNERRVARAFVVDYDFQVKGQPLSYIQYADGAPARPASPRIMLLSSIAKALPVPSGRAPSSPAFSNLWNTADGTTPVGWAGWGARDGQDLRMKRINLGDMFLQLILNNKSSNSFATYVIDGSTNTLDPNVNISAYFLDSSQLYLLDTSGVVQYSEILHESKYFISDGTWRTGGAFGPTIHHPDPIDLQAAADAFLNGSTDNPSSKFNTTRQDVFNSMSNFVFYFIQWRNDSGSYHYNQSSSYCCDPQSPLVTAQGNLNVLSAYLINKN